MAHRRRKSMLYLRLWWVGKRRWAQGKDINNTFVTRVGVRDKEWALGLLKLSVPFRTFWERIFWNSAILRIRATYERASNRYCSWLLLSLPSEVPEEREG